MTYMTHIIITILAHIVLKKVNLTWQIQADIFGIPEMRDAQNAKGNKSHNKIQ